MERLTKARRPVRASITRTVNKIEEELGKADVDKHLLKGFLDELERLSDNIQELDQKVMDLMLDENKPEVEQDKEEEDMSEYRMKISRARSVIEGFLHPAIAIVPVPSESGQILDSVSSASEFKKQCKYKLPKIELEKFSGEFSEWLGWWAQFSKIHEDTSLHTTDKFQYLKNFIVPGSKASEIVKGYSMTEANYPKVIEALTESFGNPEVLQDVYIRELLKLVVNTAKGKEALPLAQLFNQLDSHLRSLESLRISQQLMAKFLYPMVESSLGEETLTAWQRSPNFEKDGSKEIPIMSKLDYLLVFLKKEVKNEQQRTLARQGFSSQGDSKKSEESTDRKRSIPKERVKVSGSATAAGLFVGHGHSKACVFCDKSHPSQECSKAIEMDVGAKNKCIQNKNACFACLQSGHRAKVCKYHVKCTGCSKRHYHLMCPENSKNMKIPEEQAQKASTSNSISNQVSGGLVLLKTLLIRIDTFCHNQILRVLFDDGSQRSYIRTAIAKQAKCREIGRYFEKNSLFGGVVSDLEERTLYQVPLKSLKGKNLREVKLSDKNRIAGNIPKVPKGQWFSELRKMGIWINDSEKVETQDGEIDVLIGADLMPQLTTGRIEKLDCGLVAVETVFGWTLMGPVPETNVKLSTSMATISMLLTDSSVSQLWELETLGIRDPSENKSKEQREEEVRKHFQETVNRSSDGRYCVSLPWVNGIQKIPDNRSVAEKRLLGTTKKLKDHGRYSDYDEIFKKWEKEDFIEEVLEHNCQPSHYVPHRPVYKPESKTTPVRPVFDASSKAGRFPSLNECLEKGPNLIELIPSIMLRFREGKIGVASDIRKAFQMIAMDRTEQDYLRFLWWEDKTCQKIKIFRHKRVVFGVNCSPFILGAVIDYHLDSVTSQDKEVAQKLKKSFYVDNCVTSVNSLDEYNHFKGDATRIMGSAKMELREWESTVLDNRGISNGGTTSQVSTVLGMKWDRLLDTLSCDTIPAIPETVTKRIVLSTVSQIFDPMGFLAPAMVFPKLMLQEAWAQKVGWDIELSQEITDRFLKWVNEIKYLEEIYIPRNMMGGNSTDAISSMQFHAFCDASGNAYAAAIFLRVVQKNEDVSVQLLQAKSRVAPLKKTTIPRLELLGCVIQTRLAKSVQEALKYKIPIYYWSDSTTVLSWIRRNDEWGTFVGNRVREICQLTNVEDWRYVSGSKNPADFPSRGCTPKMLLESRWWEGPEWLKKHPSEWPVGDMELDEEEINSERRKTISQVTCSKNVPVILENPWYSSKYSSYLTTVRIMAWVLRYVNKLRNITQLKGGLTCLEIEQAEHQIFRLMQAEVFPKEGDYIAGLQIQRKKENGLICVRTKIVNRPDFASFRWPVLLPHEHPIVDMLIRETHLKSGHGGIQHIIGKLREKVWIVQTRKAVQKIVRGCVVCRRFSAKAVSVPSAPLPENRVKTARVFQISGVDLAGPLYLKDSSKVWIVLFSCAFIRAVHLELVENLNTDSFMLSMQRFISRRGRPSVIYSDNGTNFKGSINLFRTLDWNRIQEETKIHRIHWIFNPPSAPWWGGFWERLIRTVKDLLRKMLGHSKLSYVQLETCLSHVESVVNGRPLTYITEDPDDLVPLTPAAFLQDTQDVEFPELQTLDGRGFRAKYRDLVQLKDELRSRFRSEYLGILVQRVKAHQVREFKIGEVVLIASENLKRLEWPMARILKLIPGRDGNVRVARVKTGSGELTRPLQRLIPLEVSSDSNLFPLSPGLVTRAGKLEREVMGLNTGRPKGTKKNVCEENQEVVTKSGRKVTKPLRFRFN